MLLPLLFVLSTSFADECEEDAILVENASYVDGTCVIAWDSSDCIYDCFTDSEDARPSPYQSGAWFDCGPGSSAAMIRLRADNGNQDRALFWYDDAGQILGVTGGSNGPYCCEEQQSFPTTLVTYGAPMQTCYAPTPYKLPDMSYSGECVDSTQSCNTAGTSKATGILSLLVTLILFRRRANV